MNLPNIPHASVKELDDRVEIKMEDNYVFYRSDVFTEDVPEDEIWYSNYGVFAPDFDFNYIIVKEK